MSSIFKLRRGTTAAIAAATGAAGELFFDIQKNTLVPQDGVTAGGYPLAKLSDVATAVATLLASIQAGTELSAIAGGTVNAITATLATTLSSYTNGEPFTLISSGANAAAGVTAVITLGSTVQASVNIVKGGNQPLAIGDTGPAGYPMALIYSQTFGALVLLNPATAIGVLSSGKNRLINGAIAVDQRNNGAAQTITAAAALAYTVDRWYGYCTGANVTGQRVAGSGGARYVYQFTGAAGVTGIGFGQRIEAANSYDLNGATATLSVELENSLLTTVTWAAYYASTTDTFGTIASPTKTLIATGTFTVSATRTRYSTPIQIPAAATTGIEVVFSVGAQTSGTWTIGNAQLEAGSVATPFDQRIYGDVLRQCYRYHYVMPAGSYTFPSPGSPGYAYNQRYDFKETMRAVPTLVLSYGPIVNMASSSTASTTPDFCVVNYVATAVGNVLWTVGITADAEL